MDTLSPSERSERMARVRGRDSKPEMLVRRLIHAMGFRYRLHDRRLPGAPDLVFPRLRKVIFVHGCFWHRHPDPNCKLARMPKSRLDFWMPKLQGNRERDARCQAELAALGWRFLVVWECQMRDKEQLKNKMRVFLSDGGSE
jgi:DNA mismatch endonuclease (patch repair protein)